MTASFSKSDEPTKPYTARVSGPLPTHFLNAISDATHDAIERGMAPDEACSLLVTVATDYARGNYGDEYAATLCDVIKHRLGEAPKT